MSDILFSRRLFASRPRVRGGARFGLGLASFAANTRQSSGKKAGGDIDFAAFYILPVPSSLSAKWRRVKIGSLPSFSPSLRMPPKHPLRSHALDFYAAVLPRRIFAIILMISRAAWSCGKQPMRGRNPDKAIMIFA